MIHSCDSTNIVVPLDGAGGKLDTTISSPIQVHGITKVPARRAPALGSTMRKSSATRVQRE